MEKKKAEIIDIIDIPGFRRIIATTKDEVIREMSVGGYIKLIFGNENPIARSFTIAQLDENSFALDFVKHQSEGIASNWQRNASIGDAFEFKGPGPASPFNDSATSYYMAVDETALPALRSHLKNIDAQKKVHLYLAIPAATHEEYLSPLNSVILYSDLPSFLEAISQHDLNNSALWVAGEHEMAKKIRGHVRELNFQTRYISSYWQLDTPDEKHRLQKIKLK